MERQIIGDNREKWWKILIILIFHHWVEFFKKNVSSSIFMICSILFVTVTKYQKMLKKRLDMFEKNMTPIDYRLPSIPAGHVAALSFSLLDGMKWKVWKNFFFLNSENFGVQKTEFRAQIVNKFYSLFSENEVSKKTPLNEFCPLLYPDFPILNLETVATKSFRLRSTSALSTSCDLLRMRARVTGSGNV